MASGRKRPRNITPTTFELSQLLTHAIFEHQPPAVFALLQLGADPCTSLYFDIEYTPLDIALAELFDTLPSDQFDQKATAVYALLMSKINASSRTQQREVAERAYRRFLAAHPHAATQPPSMEEHT